jgi:putative hydrolase of the HAD superfamily
MGNNVNEQWALVDLDGTLYPMGIGVMRRIGSRIDRFMQDRLGLDEAEIRSLRQTYYRRHGTSMRGLFLNHGVDPDQYLRYVHSVSVSGLLAPNEGLGRALARCPWRKVIFTNASVEHALNVLDALEVGQHFEHIYDIRSTGYVGKPEPQAYHRVLRLLGVPAQRCWLFDDSLANLQTAKRLGLQTVWVGSDSTVDGVDFAIGCLEQINQITEQILAAEAREGDGHNEEGIAHHA